MTRAPLEPRHRAVFLDRDGTIMHDVDFCSKPEAVEIFEGAAEALRRLKEAGFKLFVITNQSGIGRGYFSENEYRAVENEVERKLGPGLIDATYFCPDKPGTESSRRKPSPEMVFEAAREHDVDLSRSFFVGDKAIDVECGQNAGMRTILVRTGYAETNQCKPTWTADNLGGAAEIILREAK
jgi:D-glycero-D-manno-heptose 1,7-bisphosphate phosphatase